MSEFVVTVKDREGKRVQLRREASGQNHLVEELHREGHFVIQIAEAQNRQFDGRSKGWPRISHGGKKKGRRVKADRLVFFTRQLATMVSAGIPLVKILRNLASEENPKFREILRQVSNDVEQGSTFTDALRRHPRVFNRLYIALVESGEESGQLDVVLEQLANYLEATAEIRMKVKSALRYPTFVFCFISLIFIVFILKVIPKFAQIYEQFGAQLPLPTQMVISFSTLVRQHLLHAIVLIGLMIVGLKLALQTEMGRFFYDRLKLRLPIVGKIIKRVVVSRLARTLSVLAHSGMPIVGALLVVSRAANNKLYERAVQRAKDLVVEGQSLAAALQQTGAFPQLLLQMVSTGEESGSLDQMFGRVADFYDKQVKVSLEGIVSLIEPITIVALGVVVGGILLVMYLPIFRLGMVLR